MDVHELLLLLQQPDALMQRDMAAIEQLTKKYPYFQTAWLLLAGRSFWQNESTAEEKLNLAAAHVINRVKLYMFLHQPVTVADGSINKDASVKQDKVTEAKTVDGDNLEDLLRSIHDRKQQFLGTTGELVPGVENDESGLQESNVLAEKVSGSSFTFSEIEMNETAVLDGAVTAEKQDMTLAPVQEAKQISAEADNLEFMLTNERAGSGDYTPLHELLNEENDENNFTEEHDPEVESNSVIEEEFILFDIDQDLKLMEIGNISAAESNLQVDTENDGVEAMEDDHGLIAWKELEWQVLQQDEADREQELEFINKTAGGGAEFTPIELEEDTDAPETIEVIPELDSILQLESISQGPDLTNIVATDEPAATASDSLRFSEQVPSPGLFLPGKSHSFIDWLRFFRPENQVAPEVIVEKTIEPPPPSKPDYQEAIGDIGAIGSGMLDELNAIDRIVSSIRPETAGKADLLRSPEELARKSVEMDDELVTETLANIYEEQGKTDKAIRTYARLSLKFPEKSLFFAARIKALKSKK